MWRCVVGTRPSLLPRGIFGGVLVPMVRGGALGRVRGGGCTIVCGGGRNTVVGTAVGSGATVVGIAVGMCRDVGGIAGSRASTVRGRDVRDGLAVRSPLWI